MTASRLSLLAYLARSQLETRHAGSAGGMAWAIIAPLALIATMWVALDLGLGLRQLVSADYSLMLVLGMLPWLAFSDAIGDATHSVQRAPHLVKKMVFPVELLPVASVLAAYAVHLVLLVGAILMFAFMGRISLAGMLLLPLWLGLGFALACGIALLAAGLNVIVRDTGTIVPFMTTIWFWLTPVIWPLNRVPADWLWLVALNPMSIVIEGYRSALLATPFPFGAGQVALSLTCVGAVVIAGFSLFQLLRPSFADAI
jgi:lipopolysaccharide transport system permease protein